MALSYRSSFPGIPFPRGRTTTELPSNVKVVGEFKGRKGVYAIESDELFRKYINALIQISVSHTLNREFMKNAGIGGAPYQLDEAPRATLREGLDEYELSELDKVPEVPRAILRDDGLHGELEVLVEAYAAGVSPACITVYSTQPERAQAFLSRHFGTHEFGPH